MNMGRLPLWVAAPVSGLLLVLGLCCFVNFAPASTGMEVPLLHLRSTPADFSCDGRFEFVQVLADGSTRINGREIPGDRLGPVIAGIMETRAERVVYLVPDTEISYGRFAQTLGTLNNAADGMHIAVLSGHVKSAFSERRLSPCDLVWPGNPGWYQSANN
jgi:hypothetical protein